MRATPGESVPVTLAGVDAPRAPSHAVLGTARGGRSGNGPVDVAELVAPLARFDTERGDELELEQLLADRRRRTDMSG